MKAVALILLALPLVSAGAEIEKPAILWDRALEGDVYGSALAGDTVVLLISQAARSRMDDRGARRRGPAAPSGGERRRALRSDLRSLAPSSWRTRRDPRAGRRLGRRAMALPSPGRGDERERRRARRLFVAGDARRRLPLCRGSRPASRQEGRGRPQHPLLPEPDGREAALEHEDPDGHDRPEPCYECGLGARRPRVRRLGGRQAQPTCPLVHRLQFRPRARGPGSRRGVPARAWASSGLVEGWATLWERRGAPGPSDRRYWTASSTRPSRSPGRGQERARPIASERCGISPNTSRRTSRSTPRAGGSSGSRDFRTRSARERTSATGSTSSAGTITSIAWTVGTARRAGASLDFGDSAPTPMPWKGQLLLAFKRRLVAIGEGARARERQAVEGAAHTRPVRRGFLSQTSTASAARAPWRWSASRCRWRPSPCR